MKIRILSSAGQDLVDGYRFFENQSEGMGDYFLDSLYDRILAFAIEWFTQRWVNKTRPGAQTFTNYIRRGTGDRYPQSAIAAVAQPWELEIADALEDRFADIRRAARSVSRLHTAFRQHAKLERTLAEKGGPGDGVSVQPNVQARRS